MTEKLAGQLAVGINSPMRIYLSGDLGGGKTLWTRALLRALGETGRVPSPSFALRLVIKLQADECIIWTYSANRGDLPPDLAELVDDDAVSVVEWPERAGDLPMRIYFCVLIL